TIIDYYKQQKNQPGTLSSKSFSNVLSASQLEVYNGCPYKYFCQYGLALQPYQSASLQANEIGTLVHYILDSSTPFFKNNQHSKTIEISSIQEHIHKTIATYINENSDIKRKLEQPKNKFFIECIQEDMIHTIMILMQQMQASSFHVDSTEEKLYATYGDFDIKGFVDRVDVFSNYIKVIDYKSSDKDLDLGLAMQGFNIQMLLYMDILAKDKQLEKGALLYFNTKKRILKSSLSILEEEQVENFFKQYRMNGYVVDDIVEDIDNQIDGTSNIIKVRHVKRDNSYKGNVITKDSLEKLLSIVGEHISYLYQKIYTGTISISPKGSNDPAIHTKVNPCSYCSYRSICNLDVFYNNPTLVKNIDIEAVLGGDDNAD
ncbi:MAG: PD-(D/E)XK nuclease family protein, partial [Coprobacillaceae bacterium]